MKKKMWMPFVMIGLMAIIMFGLMTMFNSMLSEVNSTEMWRVMVIPFLGLLIMFALMFFFFRWMTGSNGLMSMMMGTRPKTQLQSEKPNLKTMTFNVPAVNCAHCKMKIEEELGSLSGIASVNVNVDDKQAIVQLISPPTKTEIEMLLAEIGYPPEK